MRAVGALVAASALLAGCESCKKQPPPIHFESGVDAQTAIVTDDVALADVAVDVPRFVAREATVLATATPTLTADGATVTAPDGEQFTASLAVDLDGDGTTTDLVATRIRADGTAAGLSLYRRADNGLTGGPLERSAPTDARCARASLRQTSTRSLSLVWSCATSTLSDAGAPPVRDDGAEAIWVALGATPAVRGRAALAHGTLPDTALSLTAEGADRDGDGVDELVVTVAAGRPGRPAGARASIVYFDRNGTLTRDTAEPAASLHAVVEGVRRTLNARRRPTALSAIGTLDDLIRLRRALCTTYGMARVELNGARGVSCGAPEGADLRARAWSILGESPATLAVLSGAGREEGGDISERVQAELGRGVTFDRRATLREGPPAGAPLDTLAPWRTGVLRLESAQNPVSIVLHGPATGRADTATLQFVAGEAGTVDDIAARTVGGAWRIVGAVETCDGVGAVLCPGSMPECAQTPFAAGATTLPQGAVVRALGEVPSLETARRCAGGASVVQGLRADAFQVLGTNATGWLLAREGRLVRLDAGGNVARVLTGEALAAGWASGGAVAENGAAVVMADTRGVWVRDRTGWKVLAPTTLEGRASQLHDLTVANDGRMVVGLLGNNLVVVERGRR